MCMSWGIVLPLLMIVGGFVFSWAYGLGHAQGKRDLLDAYTRAAAEKELQQLREENTRLARSGRP